ncbi:sugar ABC transporter substrate-binding protein [Mesorhizobium tamadayense]|uniref:Sugar ABC transporter substrate-binding protein n=1 Tax=Mesorhizobium tamadayense TaxID=425306 RepID=A0A3P3G3P1_9HYPH|nr:ABC transporter substrate-binding protein [Mesorhizobium tamadayense]RRI05397.1 sugar ABC transporter substrate-binding protein [Mesorhizobium tamadayense]
MLRKHALFAVAGAMALAIASHGAHAAAKIKIGFLPGVVDPFYQVMQIGVEAAAKDLGVDVVTQVPPTWGVDIQTPILDSMVARGDLDYIVTAPTDKDQMVGPLKAAVDAGIKVITVDTFLGDGDYVNGPVKFPISYIGSDNIEGGRISARGLAKAIGGKGTVYINSTNPNVSSVEGREKGFKEVMEKEFPNIKVLGPDYNLDDPNKATQQTAAVLERDPGLGGVFGTNVFSAQGAGAAVVNAGLGGHVQVVAYDATKLAIELLNKGVVTLVLAQKPYDMGYMAVQFAVADAAGVTSLPRRVETGFAIIDKENVKDPTIARFIYQVPGK